MPRARLPVSGTGDTAGSRSALTSVLLPSPTSPITNRRRLGRLGSTSITAPKCARNNSGTSFAATSRRWSANATRL
eukprot:4471255-Prymnesium_polylepis.1